MKAFESTRIFFDQAADRLEIDPDLREALLMPQREVQVQVTIRLDDGRLANYVGFRVQHDHSRG
ncbi:MAG: glutamate dehydrogenase, partial [Rhodopirellula bahusiensis]